MRSRYNLEARESSLYSDNSEIPVPDMKTLTRHSFSLKGQIKIKCFFNRTIIVRTQYCKLTQIKYEEWNSEYSERRCFIINQNNQ